ncbi:MAG: TVP38/TMEM64 family protein [Zetaproteobacteria bacterium]|nr:MAG: TVP38/TMEM64 family protein [Zetaproteobacteria bacterium]
MYFDVPSLFSLDALAQHRAQLLRWTSQFGWLAPLTYMALYVAVVAFSVPGATVMTLAGGFLFGAVMGAVYASTGATIGAALLFLAARGALSAWLKRRVGERLHRLRQGFEHHAFSYLLMLRLIPLFPFFVVNLVPAFSGMRLRDYVLATWLGVMPAAFVYALAGSGMGEVLAHGGGWSLGGVMTPKVVAALVGLAVLALLPVVYRRGARV